MGQALIGLAGVVVGALLSGGATYLMAKRVEARKARAAARLLEAELRPTARGLEALRRHKPGGINAAAVGHVVSLPEPRLWKEHSSLLAEVLEASDWYALAAAYDSIDIITRTIELASRSGTELVPVELLEPAITLVEHGAQAVSHVAGGGAGAQRAQRAQANHDAALAVLMRVEASGESGTARARGPAAQELPQRRQHPA